VTEESTPRSRAREQQREFRRIIANAVGELRSNEIRDSYAALSLEELIDQQIDRLEGTNDTLNPSRLQRIQRIRQELADNIEAMKATPPSSFRRHDPDGDVNTAP
jgi:hypothetical protein